MDSDVVVALSGAFLKSDSRMKLDPFEILSIYAKSAVVRSGESINTHMQIQEILSQQRKIPSGGKAIYTAGVPASGKTTLAREIFGSQGFRSIDPDDIYRLLQKRGETADYQRPEVQDIKQRRLEKALELKQNIIIDTTGLDASRIASGKAQLEKLGYQTAMMFVQRDPEQAYHASIRREFSTGRSVDAEYIERVNQALNNNIRTYQTLFGPADFFLINTDQGQSWSIDFSRPIWNQLPERTRKKIEVFLKKPL
jgi:predicted kinase